MSEMYHGVQECPSVKKICEVLHLMATPEMFVYTDQYASHLQLVLAMLYLHATFMVQGHLNDVHCTFLDCSCQRVEGMVNGSGLELFCYNKPTLI